VVSAGQGRKSRFVQVPAQYADGWLRMEWLNRTWRGFRYPLIGCLMFAPSWVLGISRYACASDGRLAIFADLSTVRERGACILDFYAYLRVASLAQELGSYGNVFADALDDLQDQLADCLSDPDVLDVISIPERRSDAEFVPLVISPKADRL
jgi:hypothetical protein